MKVAVTTVVCENLAKHNVAKPNGWTFFTLQDRVRINEWNPDMVVCLGWFCRSWAEWAAHKATFGDTRKIIIQWVGTDILVVKEAYEKGHKAILEWLKSDRFLHVAPTKEAVQELEWTGLKMYGPIDVPAEKIIEPQPMPDKIRLAIYIPPDHQDFYGIKLISEVLPTFKKEIEVVFYHWLPATHKIRYGHRCETHYALSREEYEEKILKGCSALVRIPVHDAGSISVGEFFMAGKPVITNQNLPHWSHGVKGNLYIEDKGDFKLTKSAGIKFRKEVQEILDLLKNAKEPVPQKTMDHYRRVYDPATYAATLSEYTQDQWGVSIA